MFVQIPATTHVSRHIHRVLWVLDVFCDDPDLPPRRRGIPIARATNEEAHLTAVDGGDVGVSHGFDLGGLGAHHRVVVVLIELLFFETILTADALSIFRHLSPPRFGW